MPQRGSAQAAKRPALHPEPTHPELTDGQVVTATLSPSVHTLLLGLHLWLLRGKSDATLAGWPTLYWAAPIGFSTPSEVREESDGQIKPLYSVAA